MTTAGQLLKYSYFSDFCCVSDRPRLMEPFDGLHRGQAFSPGLGWLNILSITTTQRGLSSLGAKYNTMRIVRSHRAGFKRRKGAYAIPHKERELVDPLSPSPQGRQGR